MAIYKNNTKVKDIYMVGHGLPDPNVVGLQEDVDYVRYEWLKTNDAAWIDTLISDFTGVNDLTFHVKKLTDSYGAVMGCEGPQNASRFIFDMDYYQAKNRLVWYVSTVSNARNGKDFVVHVNFTDNKVKVNGVTTIYTAVEIPKTLRYTCPLFAKKTLSGNPNGRNSIVYMEYFKIDDSMHLVPCRLLHSIPASLDANNKARQEGEYGMIDLVSKRFYGNVNNSGSFTGEGLIQKKVTFAFFNGKHVFGEMQEAVHIRRYGWLKASSNNNCIMQRYPIRSTNLYFKRVRLSGKNFGYFGTHGYTYHCNSNYNIAIWNNKTNSTQFYDSSSNVSIGKVITINCNTNNITIDGRDIPIYGYPISSVTEMFSDSNGGQTLTSSIIVDGSIRYTPCKLLRPIPPELDANGIARAAGVCGMYDEINHKFYGNVASSGSFTVEGMAEGYDYEVYNYLKGTGGCHIDTLINPAWNDQLSATTEVEGQPTDKWAFILSASGTESSIILCTDKYWFENNNPSVVVSQRQGGSDNISFKGFSATAEIYISLKVTNNATPTYSCKINGTAWAGTVNGTNIITTLPDTTYKIGKSTTGLDVLKLRNVKINSHNFIPCKLKRAIPAELDANGIAREAEECGMVDTYSGLFYGNVNNVGTFTVEGEGLVKGYHYETHQWLKGDGSAYITHKDVDTLEVKVLELNDTGASYEFGYLTDSTLTPRLYMGSGVTTGSNYSGLIIYRGTSTVRANYRTPNLFISKGEHIITKNAQTDEIGVFTDGVRHIKNATTDSDYVGTNIIFNQLKPTQNLYIGYLSSPNILHLVPCKLLTSIPAILDGNGIARQAGECGMWDKVSNRFYGNAGKSGSFTVEGARCYEEYQWLNCYTVDGVTFPAQGADIGITPIPLTNKVLTIELGKVSRNVSVFGDSPYFIHMWCMYANNAYVMNVQERKGNDNIIHNMSYNWDTSNTITLDFINNIVTLGNSTFQIEGTGYTFKGFNSSMWQNPRTVGRIKISDELDLVPCKLTHGIPASMDANGIARSAGTCGMWDKKNDKFYGNVGSGSFTVSNI